MRGEFEFRFTAERMAGQYLEIYHELAGARTSAAVDRTLRPRRINNAPWKFARSEESRGNAKNFDVSA